MSQQVAQAPRIQAVLVGDCLPPLLQGLQHLAGQKLVAVGERLRPLLPHGRGEILQTQGVACVAGILAFPHR